MRKIQKILKIHKSLPQSESENEGYNSVVLYDCVKVECGKWRTTVTATTDAEAVLAHL